jgi:hypothetical protein
LCQVLTLGTVRGSAAGFVYANIFSDHRLRDDYHAFYRHHIDMLRSESPKFFGGGHPSTLGDVIFFVKQESLNGLLMQPGITPQLLKASSDGILFKDFYANSIQSIRGYECILCGVPPNVTGALVDESSPAELPAKNIPITGISHFLFLCRKPEFPHYALRRVDRVRKGARRRHHAAG